MVLFLLKPLHSKEIFLSENFLLKMASVKLSMVTSSIKGFHVYWRSPDIGEWLKCVLEETNRHNNTAIKVAGDTNETIGHILRSGSRTAATSKMEHFVIIVKVLKPLTTITKHSILDVASVLDPCLYIWWIIWGGCTSTKKRNEAEVTVHLLDAAEGKWKLGGEIKVPCIYRFYGPKINKPEFRNKLSK